MQTFSEPRALRVLTFLHALELGGVERTAVRLVRAWREAGIDAPLFVGRMGEGCVPGLACEIPPAPVSPARFETLWMILTLPRRILSVRPDIVFCAGNTYAVVAVAMKLLLGRRCPPVVVKVSNTFDRPDLPAPVRPFYRLWTRLQAHFLDQLVALDPAMAEESARVAGLDPRRIVTIANPALTEHDINAIHDQPRASAPGRGRRFVSVGRLVAQKDHALMLRAFAAGADADDRLTLIGDGPERARLERLVQSLGVAARVVFAGHRSEPALELGRYDIFLLSSSYEGLPSAVVEALAAGLPVVAMDCGAAMAGLLAPEHDGGRPLGTLVPRGDEAGFARAIEAARAGDQHTAAAFARAGQFTAGRAARAYLDLFRRVAARAVRPMPVTGVLRHAS